MSHPDSDVPPLPRPDTELEARSSLGFVVSSSERKLDQSAGVTEDHGSRLGSAVVIAIYCLVGAAAFWPVLPDISTRLFGADWDYAQSVWFLGWIPHALAHGLNPFFSGAMFAPAGVNLAQNTSSPLLGLMTAPLAAMTTPVVIANLVMVTAMPISAAAAYIVLRKWRVWVPAAGLGGLVYGFSPYMVGQSLGHVDLMFLPLPPFIAYTVAAIVRRDGPPVRLGVRLGFLVVAQYFISPEILATVVLFTVVALVCVVFREPSRALQTARPLMRPVGLALVGIVV